MQSCKKTILLLLVFVNMSFAGMLSDSLFRSFSSSLNLVNQDSLKLAVSSYILANMQYVTRPSNTTSRMRSPDITGFGDGHFSFFWADSARSAHTTDNIYRREFHILPTSIDTTLPFVLVCNTARPQVNYLHADHGLSSYLVSFIDNNLDTMKAYGDPSSNPLYRVGAGTGSTTRETQCHWKNDTFLVVYQKDPTHVLMRRVYYVNTTVTQSIVEDTVSVAPDGLPVHSISNPSIAADSKGNVVVMWMQGTSIVQKTLKGMVYNNARVKTDSMNFSATPMDSSGMMTYAEASPVAAYGDSLFGSVSWDPVGVFFRSIHLHSPLIIDVVRLNTGSNSRYPSIASNGRYIVAIWMSDSLKGDTLVKISGMRDTVKAGYIPFSSNTNLSRISDVWIPSNKIPGKTVSTFALNCAMDSIGSFGATWPLDSLVYARLWAQRGVRVPAGEWISSSTRYMGNNSDSVSFLPSTFIVNQEQYQTVNTDSVRVYVHAGLDSADESAWCPWTSVTDSTALAVNTKGAYRFFKYKVDLYRGVDTIGTPVVKKCSFRWNAKPVLQSIDSIYVNGKKTAAKTFGSIDTCYSRSDTVTLFYTVRDADIADTVYTTISGYSSLVHAVDTMRTMAQRSTFVTFLPCAKSDTTIVMTFSIVDKSGWHGTSQTFSIRTRNPSPVLSVRAVVDTNSDGIRDTVTLNVKRMLLVQQNDSITFLYSCQDSNDNTAATRAYLYLDNVKSDSAQQNLIRQYVYKGATGQAQGDTMRFAFADPDKSVADTVTLRVNHFPVITSVTAAGKTVHNHDTVSVSIGAAVTVSVMVHDTDVTYWDHITYRFTRASKDTTTTASSLTFIPALSDSSMLVRATDIYGKSDTVRLYFKSPWLATDSVHNKAYAAAKIVLQDSVAIVKGAVEIDTAIIPLVNTGNDTLTMTSLVFNATAARWLFVNVPFATGAVMYDSAPAGIIPALKIPPNTTKNIFVVLNASGLRGDGVVRDTIIIGTNDFSHSFDTIPVNFEFNTLPTIASVSLSFPADTPYWLAKRTATKTYTFPPHAKISIRFSEAMDTASAANAIWAYSALDSQLTSTPPKILFDRSWQNGDSVLLLSPRYTAPSVFFNGFMPPAGFFIPGDSIHFFVTSALTDQAKTPHGENSLDIHRNATRVILADTVIPLRVDSITYTLTSVSPANKDTGVSATSKITLTFSSPPLPSTVDTSKSKNRSLIVRSKYFGWAIVPFSAISTKGDSVVFTLKRQFFYGDSVHCYYSARWIRDSLGYPVDLNKNGIPMSMFDTTSTEDDKAWGFVIKDNIHTLLTPASNAVSVAPKTAIAVTFADSVPLYCVDTAHTGNTQLVVTSSFLRGAQLVFDSVRVRQKTIAFYPHPRLYFGDTIKCIYNGLLTKDSTRFAVDLSHQSVLLSSDKATWQFVIRDMRLLSVTPDSTATASIQPVIRMIFSDPVLPGTFDTDTTNHNSSFSVKSTYVSASYLPFKNISFSADSTQVSIKTNAVFFSGDSVHCIFTGFVKNYRYDTLVNLPNKILPVICSHDWCFKTGNVGFYTYPNPYKPGTDPRHCGSAQAPCGIVFTNLHALKSGVTDLIVKVMGTNGNPVYNSQTAGQTIHFAANDPHSQPVWKWDTRNLHGELVASGLYFFAITDLSGNVLTKGKLIIVR